MPSTCGCLYSLITPYYSSLGDGMCPPIRMPYRPHSAAQTSDEVARRCDGIILDARSSARYGSAASLALQGLYIVIP
jgi:hypothetical protein